ADGDGLPGRAGGHRRRGDRCPPHRPDRDGRRDRGRALETAVRQRGGRTAGQPRPDRPALHLPVVPPAWLRLTAPEPTGARRLPGEPLGDDPGNRPTPPGLGAPPIPGLQRGVLAARPGVATARRTGTAGPPPAAPLPPHRPLDGPRGAGAGGLPVVSPRPGSAAGVRL